MSGLLLALLATLNVDTAWVLLNADYRTGPGERRALRLSDGSHVDLGPESALAVRFTARQRCVELLAGLAYFAPQPRDTDERRPFRVTAADGTVTALGTRFVVDQLGAVVDVVVAEDRVEVALAETARVVLASGQTVRYGGNGLGEVQAVNLNHVTAWRRDRLIVNQRPLREVITVLNRYRRGRIILAGRALAARRVSGVFDLAQPDTALAAIARDLKLKRLTLPLWVTLLH
jgi:transmembrane sensor